MSGTDKLVGLFSLIVIFTLVVETVMFTSNRIKIENNASRIEQLEQGR